MKENISAFMDGELDERAAVQLMDALSRDKEALQAWRTYHLIRDTLHDNAPLSAGFSTRFAEALGKEPTVLAPKRLRREPRVRQPHAWYAAAASLAAVALVAWLGLAPQQQAPLVAKAPPAEAAVALPLQAVRAPSSPAVVPLPSGTHDYLLAHQGVSPRISLQGMAPYVRTVSEQVQEPRR